MIKPLAASAQPLVGWRLRDVGEFRSRLLMEGLSTYANCHSLSQDGKTRRAGALAIGANQQHLAEAVKARIGLYERQTPFRSR